MTMLRSHRYRELLGAMAVGLAYLWLVACINAGDLKVIGPSGGVPGDIIALTAQVDDSTLTHHFAWTVIPSQTSTGRPTWLEIDDDRIIIASVPGTYSIVCAAGNADAVMQTLWVVTIEGVRPTPPVPPTPPGPTPPGPTPDPTPSDAPFACNGLHVLIVYETGAAMMPAQELIIYSTKVREYLDTHCASKAAWRIYDKDIDTANDAKVWQDAMGVPRGGVPWVVISNGKTGVSQALPATVDDFLALVKRFE